MTFTIRSIQPLVVTARFLPVAVGLSACTLFAGLPAALAQGSLFTTVPVDQSKFILVSAPIGTGERSQLNIYEQRSDSVLASLWLRTPQWLILCCQSLISLGSAIATSTATVIPCASVEMILEPAIA